jgi:hypothetical protein
MTSNCTFCGEPFHWNYRKNRPSLYCSRACFGNHQTEKRKLDRSKIPHPEGLLFSKEDRDLYSIAWRKDAAGYFVTSHYIKSSKAQERWFAHQMVFERMHGFIPRKAEGREIDHWNRNKSDNRRDNLKLATCQQNIANTDRIECAKRVTWNKAANRWQGMYAWRGRNYYVGLFSDRAMAETETAKHRNETLRLSL